METPGQRLKRVRERLALRFRDVEAASLRIAEQRRNPAYSILISRLADIEQKGTLPTLFRLYSLCAIYHLDFTDVLGWYGIDPTKLPADSQLSPARATHLSAQEAQPAAEVYFPLALDPHLDLSRTAFVSESIRRWGKLPLLLLSRFSTDDLRYGYIGLEDRRMSPILPPGSFIVVDQSQRRIRSSGWTHEWERPIYFLEHRQGFVCGWCSLREDQLVVSGHPASQSSPLVFTYPRDADVIGRVRGVAHPL